MPQEQALEKAVDTLISGYKNKITGFGISEFLETGVDPFRFTVNVSIWGLKAAIRKEIEHQIEMTLENLVGDFHENYLGNTRHIPTNTKWKMIPEGNMPGIDIANYEQKIYLQIKSKHNSMNSSSSKKLAQELGELAETIPDATVGCVWVVATQRKKAIGENLISEVGVCYKGNKVYEIITGEEGELNKVLEALLVLIPNKIGETNFDDLLDTAAERVSTALIQLAAASNKTPIQVVTSKSID